MKNLELFFELTIPIPTKHSNGRLHDVERTKYLNQWKTFWTANFARVLNQAVVNVRYQFKTIKLSDNVSKEESDEYYADVDGSFLSVKVNDTNS